MPLFVELPPKQREIFFYRLKSEKGNSWKDIYEQAKISKPMFYHYLSGRYPLPKETFDKWQKEARANISNIKIIEKQKFLKKEIYEIGLDTKLAEILGILNGDGHLCPINYEICVVGSCLEKEYADHIKELFETKFGILFSLKFDNSIFKLRGYSIELFKFLTKDYKLPSGNKMGHLRIPSQIRNSKRLLVPYIRGLFDTDGTFYIRREKDAVVEISSADRRYLKEINWALRKLGFNSKKYEKYVNLYCPKDIDDFFKLVKPSNTKHLKKYKSYSNLCAGSPENLTG
jgi:intein/homing endonuclease